MSGLDEKGRDWPEDFSDENGNYMSHCAQCGHLFTGHKRRVVCKACAVTPADVGEEPVAWRWRWKHIAHWTLSTNPPSGAVTEPLYSATALERVVRDRDVARADYEWMTANRNKWQDATTIARRRATSAEAKMAEARKVIEPFASLEPPKNCRAFMQILVCPEGDTTTGDYSPHIRAARRWIEETKEPRHD